LSYNRIKLCTKYAIHKFTISQFFKFKSLYQLQSKCLLLLLSPSTFLLLLIRTEVNAVQDVIPLCKQLQ
jgi:hypothetical protein